MRTLPRDAADLMLGPVVLAVDKRLEALGTLSQGELARELALSGLGGGTGPRIRTAALLMSLQRDTALHGWQLSIDPRGVRLTNGNHSVTLGLPANLKAYLAG